MSASPLHGLTHLRIRWKLALLIGIVFLIIACFFLIFIPNRVERIGDSALAAKARVVSAMTAANITSALVFQDTAQIAEELRSAMFSRDIRYAVVADLEGRILASVNYPEAIRCEYQGTPDVGRIVAHADLWQTRERIIHRNTELGDLFLGFSRIEVGSGREQVMKETAIVTLIVFLVGLLSVIGISGAVTAHLKAVVASARAVTAGDLKSRAPEGHGDEVGELARTFNSMLDRLSVAQRNLEEVNKDLEYRVSVRTEALLKEIAEHRNTEQSLRLTEQRQRQIIDLVPHFIFAKDVEGRFVVVNEAVAKAYGTTVEQLLGRTDADVASSEEEARKFREADMEVIASGTEKLIPEEQITTAAGEVRILQTIKIPFTLSGSTIASVLGVSTDITALKTAENELKLSLREKDVLLKEIHHRVKNNLQIINSLLNLQVSDLHDPVIVDALKVSQNRIRSMALVHERLYRSGNLAGIDFSEYLELVAGQLLRAYDKRGVTCKVLSDRVTISVDAAIPCGLIVNELLTNALKHAFVGRSEGHIEVIFRKSGEDLVELTVSDDGVGLPAAIDIQTAESMGLTLVASLAQQLQATIAIDRSAGTRFCLTFHLRND
ncbi:MAG TPA: histidine kinase dimerization/phosphoacceptor domain -containing protein [Bacteroidota bacterium]|nr:histidine kinase dimerization/phosphoacceptor domain -containing protein [Bacteroidota bacterium]